MIPSSVKVIKINLTYLFPLGYHYAITLGRNNVPLVYNEYLSVLQVSIKHVAVLSRG
jgi:hypothetical protein